MTGKPPPRRSRPDERGRVKVVVDLVPPRYDPPPEPRAPEVPLFFFDRHDNPTLNWKHWAAPLWVLFKIFILVPLQLVLVAGFAFGDIVSFVARKMRRLLGRGGRAS